MKNFIRRFLRKVVMLFLGYTVRWWSLSSINLVLAIFVFLNSDVRYALAQIITIVGSLVCVYLVSKADGANDTSKHRYSMEINAIEVILACAFLGVSKTSHYEQLWSLLIFYFVLLLVIACDVIGYYVGHKVILKELPAYKENKNASVPMEKTSKSWRDSV